MKITPNLLKIMRDCTDIDMPSDAQIALLDYIDALQQQVNALAAESVAKSDRLQCLVEIIDKADNCYCMCGESMESHDASGSCGSPTGMFVYHYGQWLESRGETPATDTIQNEWMAKGLMEAIKVIPMTMSMAGKLNDLAYKIRAGEQP